MAPGTRGGLLAFGVLDFDPFVVEAMLTYKKNSNENILSILRLKTALAIDLHDVLQDSKKNSSQTIIGDGGFRIFSVLKLNESNNANFVMKRTN